MIPPTSTHRLQTNKWSCGPCALRHAILCYGVRRSWRTIARLAEIDRAFFDDESADTTEGLSRAAMELGFSVGHAWPDTLAAVKLALQNYARLRIPVLVCIDRREHWIVVASVTSRHVTILDSSRPGPVLQSLTWFNFLGRACFWTAGDGGRTRFDLYPVRDARTRKNGRMLSESEAP